MGLFDKKEKTLEDELVRKLVGTRISFGQTIGGGEIRRKIPHHDHMKPGGLNSKGKVVYKESGILWEDDKFFYRVGDKWIPNADGRGYISDSDIVKKVEEVWKNGGNCEDIQYAFDELVYPERILAKKLIYELLGNDSENVIGGKLATFGFEKKYNDKVKSKVLKTWKTHNNPQNIQQAYDHALEDMEKEILVDELVGTASIEITGELGNLNLTNDQKNEIKESVIKSWKSGESKEKIEEIYNITKERLSKGLSLISKDLYDFMKNGITLYTEKTEQKVVPTTQTIQEQVVKDEYGNLTRMGATYAIGLAGMALTSGKKTETVEKEISTTKVVNKTVKEKALEIIPSGESLRISQNEQVNYVERAEIKEYNENFKDIILNNGNVIPLDMGQDFNSNGLKEYITNGFPSNEDMIFYEKEKKELKSLNVVKKDVLVICDENSIDPTPFNAINELLDEMNIEFKVIKVKFLQKELSNSALQMCKVDISQWEILKKSINIDTVFVDKLINKYGLDPANFTWSTSGIIEDFVYVNPTIVVNNNEFIYGFNEIEIREKLGKKKCKYL